jgi:hypothetical protein
MNYTEAKPLCSSFALKEKALPVSRQAFSRKQPE